MLKKGTSVVEISIIYIGFSQFLRQKNGFLGELLSTSAARLPNVCSLVGVRCRAIRLRLRTAAATATSSVHLAVMPPLPPLPPPLPPLISVIIRVLISIIIPAT